jgi:hypothetical protein
MFCSSILKTHKKESEVKIMGNNRIELAKNRHENLTRFGFISLLLAMFCFCAITFSMSPVLAIDTSGLDNVMDIVIDLVGTAALYVGIGVALWGLFQIIMAFRREDSEGISKQLTTVIVGAVLIGFGASVEAIYRALV